MTDSPTRHAQPSGSWRDGLMVALDATSDIIGGITLLALPLAVMTPGLVALLALSIPLLLPLVALGLVAGVLSAPFAGIWLLVTMIRRAHPRDSGRSRSAWR